MNKMENAAMCLLLFSLFWFEGDSLRVKLTLLKSAVDKGAVCLDGSPPAYQLDRGVGDGVNNWLVDLEGGAWCESVEKCQRRRNYTSGLGSSHFMKEHGFEGMMSRNCSINPNFCNWNRATVRYCDGSSFTGNKDEVNATQPVYYRGARIFDAVMEDLLLKGMNSASNALLSGHSAGGMAAILNCDKFRDLFPPTTRVKCFSDGGYFAHVKDINGGYHYQEVMFDKVVLTHNSAKSLPKSCTSRMNSSLCIYPQYVVPYMKTPVFVLNSLYDTWQISKVLSLSNIEDGKEWVECQYQLSNCSYAQVKRLREFGLDVMHAVLDALTDHKSRGVFLNTCHTHCQALNARKWLGYDGQSINNKSISEAVGEWYFGNSSVKLIDTEHKLPHYCVLDQNEPNPTNNYTWNGVKM